MTEHAVTEVERADGSRRGMLPKLVVSLVIGGLFAWVSERGGVPIVPHAQAFAGVAWGRVCFAVLLLFALTLVRATRWRFLIAPVKRIPLGEVILLNWIGFFAIFALPLRLGEFVRPALSKMRARVPISAGLGTVAVERVVDGTLTSLCVAWALWHLPRLHTDDRVAQAVPYYAGLVLLVFAGARVALVAFLWKRRFAVRFTHRLVGFVSRPHSLRTRSRHHGGLGAWHSSAEWAWPLWKLSGGCFRCTSPVFC
ncbi:MAG: hypothetical protein RL385_6113 [Pseudomonadota bacterium]